VRVPSGWWTDAPVLDGGFVVAGALVRDGADVLGRADDLVEDDEADVAGATDADEAALVDRAVDESRPAPDVLDDVQPARVSTASDTATRRFEGTTNDRTFARRYPQSPAH
jgi:hypothetical protein